MDKRSVFCLDHKLKSIKHTHSIKGKPILNNADKAKIIYGVIEKLFT